LSLNQVTESIYQLYFADYRVRKFIFKSILEHVQHKTDSGQNHSHHMAFELALCYALGMGTERDEERYRQVKLEHGIAEEDVQAKLSEIHQITSGQVFKNGMYKELIADKSVLQENLSDVYRAENSLGTAISWSEREAADLESAMGGLTTLSMVVKTTLFYYLRASGRWDDAVSLRIQITDLMKASWGLDNSMTLDSMAALASIYIDQGNMSDREQLQKAERLLEEVLQIQRSSLEPEHPKILDLKYGLAGVYKAQGRYPQAEELLLSVIEIRTKVHGPTHPTTLKHLPALANIYSIMGRLDEADSLLEQIRKSAKTRLGPHNRFTIANMYSLAGLYYQQGKLEKCRELNRQVCELRMSLFGEDHPETLMVLNDLAVLESRLQNYEEAEKRHKQIIQGKITAFGDDGRSTWRSRGNLAMVYANQEHWEEAVDLGQKVVHAKRRLEGPAHYSTQGSIINLAHALAAIGNEEGARAELSQSSKDALAAGKATEPLAKQIMDLLSQLNEEDHEQ
jgi:tetratricopeptide (TPR) repeat protein